MFQPGEEGHAGARHMINEGVLDAAGQRPVAAYGLHVICRQLPGGMFSTRPGPMLAAADQITVTVHGRGGHGSQPHRAPTRSRSACEMVTALQTLVTRKFDVFDPVVITVGSFHAGTTTTSSPTEATFLATARSFSAPRPGPRWPSGAAAWSRTSPAAHGLTVDAEYATGYPVTVNDAAEAEFALKTAAEAFGEDRSAAGAVPHHRRGRLLLRAGGGAGRVRPPRRLPAGPRPGDRPHQPLGRRRLRRRGRWPKAPPSTPNSPCAASPQG